MYPALKIANYFLRKEPISAMKLQKLLFFAHGWSLGLSGKPLIREEIQAWNYGPVVPEVYHQFKYFGSDPITEEAESEWRGISFVPNFDRGTCSFLNKVWEEYGGIDAMTLSKMTHERGSPWDTTPKFHNSVIPNEEIRRYFQRLAEGADY